MSITTEQPDTSVNIFKFTLSAKFWLQELRLSKQFLEGRKQPWNCESKGQKFYIIAFLKTFALIVSAHPYCARKITCHVMHRARALSTKMNNDRADGHFYSFAWI